MQPNARLLKKALTFSAFFYVLSFNVYALDCPPQRIDESARVNYVYDGDTLQLEDGRKIRMMGIDTPEVFSRHREIEDDIKASGERAKAALQQQLSLAKQRISLSYGPQRFDRYNRTLAHVYLPDGKNLQAWLIKQGHAIAFTTPPNDTMSECYRLLENQARKAQRGIWKMPQYQLKHTTQLNENSHGYHRLQAKVTRIWQSNRKVTIFLDENVEVNIRRYDLINFNAYMLNNLAQKNVQIQGWLRVEKLNQNSRNKNRFIMSLRHPDAIKVLN